MIDSSSIAFAYDVNDVGPDFLVKVYRSSDDHLDASDVLLPGTYTYSASSSGKHSGLVELTEELVAEVNLDPATLQQKIESDFSFGESLKEYLRIEERMETA